MLRLMLRPGDFQDQSTATSVSALTEHFPTVGAALKSDNTTCIPTGGVTACAYHLYPDG